MVEVLDLELETGVLLISYVTLDQVPEFLSCKVGGDST